ncbi:hypothetical protein [Streptomyces hydrogenans]|uniref:hypothetical protein n=1 Tax=Streptomyces hydrogenans TaxID=1873719 RepID=UPI003829B7D4
MVSDEVNGTAGTVGTDTGEAAVTSGPAGAGAPAAAGTAVLLAAAPAGRGRAMDAVSVLPSLAAVPPGVLTGTATATLVELADPVDPQTVLTRLRAAAQSPGPLVLYLAGQLHLDRRQQLPHLALARSTSAALRYTALPWHWLAEAAASRPAGTATVVADLVADPEAWTRLTAAPDLLRLVPAPTLYARVGAPPRRGDLAAPDYLRAWADQWRAGARPSFAALHEEAAARTRSPQCLFLATGGGTVAPAAAEPRSGGAAVAVPGAGTGTAPAPGPAPAPVSGPVPVPVPISAPVAVPAQVVPAPAASAPAPVPVMAVAVDPGAPSAEGGEPVRTPGPAPVPLSGPAPTPAPASHPAPVPDRAPAPAVPVPVAESAERPVATAVPPLPAGFAPAEDEEAPGTMKLAPPKAKPKDADVDAEGNVRAPAVPPLPPTAPPAPAAPPSAPPPPGRAPAAVDPRRAGYGAAASAAPAAPSTPPVPAEPAVHDPHPAILSAAMAGRHAEAAEMAAAWERDALRRFGPRSGEAVHWMEVRADLARLAGEPARSCELWLAVAEARLGLRQQPDDRDVEGAVDRAHHQWEQIADPARARALGPTLVALRRRVPGRRPGALEALRRRMHSR